MSTEPTYVLYEWVPYEGYNEEARGTLEDLKAHVTRLKSKRMLHEDYFEILIETPLTLRDLLE